tara:strand:+ start:159 stop:1109 length:951 start_codon:yes stop_codon:yes gene_type:complete
MDDPLSLFASEQDPRATNGSDGAKKSAESARADSHAESGLRKVDVDLMATNKANHALKKTNKKAEKTSKTGEPVSKAASTVPASTTSSSTTTSSGSGFSYSSDLFSEERSAAKKKQFDLLDMLDGGDLEQRERSGSALDDTLFGSASAANEDSLFKVLPSSLDAKRTKGESIINIKVGGASDEADSEFDDLKSSAFLEQEDTTGDSELFGTSSTKQVKQVNVKTTTKTTTTITTSPADMELESAEALDLIAGALNLEVSASISAAPAAAAATTATATATATTTTVESSSVEVDFNNLDLDQYIAEQSEEGGGGLFD